MKQNLTELDIQLAKIYYPILIDLALRKNTLTYGELVDKAKDQHPNLEYVQKAFPLSVGRRLNAVWYFTEERGLPDLTALLISKNKGEEASDTYDKEMRKKIYSHRWSNIDEDFDSYTDELEVQITPKKRISKKESVAIMSSYYLGNKDKYPASIKKYRENIVSLLMEGIAVEEAFQSVF